MPLVREQLQKLCLSFDTIDILMASWRKSTRKQYATYLSRWVTYCKNKQLDVTHATINNRLDFLTLQTGGRLQSYQQCSIRIVLGYYTSG